MMGKEEVVIMKSAIFLANGYEECEMLIVVDMFRRANVDIQMVAMGDKRTVSAHNVVIEADCTFEQFDQNDCDVFILPGGVGGTLALDGDERVGAMLKKANEANKLVCAICAAPSVLDHNGLLKGKMATVHPSFADKCYEADLQDARVVQDDNIITGRGMGVTIDFAARILENIVDEEVVETILKGIQY